MISTMYFNVLSFHDQVQGSNPALRLATVCMCVMLAELGDLVRMESLLHAGHTPGKQAHPWVVAGKCWNTEAGRSSPCGQRLDLSVSWQLAHLEKRPKCLF